MSISLRHRQQQRQWLPQPNFAHQIIPAEVGEIGAKGTSRIRNLPSAVSVRAPAGSKRQRRLQGQLLRQQPMIMPTAARIEATDEKH